MSPSRITTDRPSTPSPPPTSGRQAQAWIQEVYDELRRMASARMAALKSGHTLQPTALVHEVWLKLAHRPEAAWESRTHFLATAAEAMRQILVDQARRKQAGKRGGGVAHDEFDDSIVTAPAPDDELLHVHEFVDALAQHDPRVADVVKLRYFIGLTLDETASHLGVSPRTVGHLWDYGRAWLLREIQRQQKR